MTDFKSKHYLKRTDFLNLMESYKICSKKLTIPEIKELLDLLEKELSNYEYDIDMNYLMNGRRFYLIFGIKERLSEKSISIDINFNIFESLMNLWEFVVEDYYGITLEAASRLNLSLKEMEDMCSEYSKSGIICLQERDNIIEIIHLIKNYIIKKVN